jgi:hypothetical protein
VNDTEGSGIGYSEAHLAVTDHGHLAIDGCGTVELVEHFGARLWAISERAIRDNVARVADVTPGSTVEYRLIRSAP